SNWEVFFHLIFSRVALIHAMCGILMPLIMLCILTRYFGRNKSWSEGLAMAPFAVFTGLAFVIPYAAAGVFLGPEFPSMIGALVGLAIVVPAAKAGFLLPKQTWDFADAKDWPSDWMGKIEMKLDEVAGKAPISVPMAWAPYLLLAAFLVISRTVPEVKAALMSLTFGWKDILGETGVSGTIEPL